MPIRNTKHNLGTEGSLSPIDASNMAKRSQAISVKSDRLLGEAGVISADQTGFQEGGASQSVNNHRRETS